MAQENSIFHKSLDLAAYFADRYSYQHGSNLIF